MSLILINTVLIEEQNTLNGNSNFIFSFEITFKTVDKSLLPILHIFDIHHLE